MEKDNNLKDGKPLPEHDWILSPSDKISSPPTIIQVKSHSEDKKKYSWSTRSDDYLKRKKEGPKTLGPGQILSAHAHNWFVKDVCEKIGAVNLADGKRLDNGDNYGSGIGEFYAFVFLFFVLIIIIAIVCVVILDGTSISRFAYIW